ncbi:DUF6924 domain-containing protein [Pseudonocardia alaniniphila]|uniref:DUF6924 domain-containing protein n=1 Tax=Pseudonocardia alaniniphila TaxID=75291 RepID=A0ABS9T8P4_9PSEU|nr:hypothetical protein [Pseudonocardia alaniniphila]MCH6164890.1 hypothetical protein [Pseudonocardia alaniniphila]
MISPVPAPPSPLRPSGCALLVRTDFSNERSWEALCEGVRTPSEDDFLATVDIVDDDAYRDLTATQLRNLYPDPHPVGPYFFFVADADAVASAEHPLLVVPVPYPEPEYAYLNEPPRATFRVVVARLWSVENNLSLANMDWAEFAHSVDEDGVFRGF